ncbi:MAG: polysaccharide biosynthesis C-terminal domain-containing protein [Pleurocapsa sp.]
MFIKKIKDFVDNKLRSPLLVSTLAFFKSYLLRLVVQGVYFVILARSFAPEKYGAYVGIVAIIAIFIPFANWGSGEILVQEASRNHSLFKDYWGAAILKSFVMGSILIGLVLIIYSFIPIENISMAIVFFTALANLIFFKLDEVARHALMSIGLLNEAAKAQVVLYLNRFVASLVFLAFFEGANILDWSILYCISTFATAVMTTAMVVRQTGYPNFSSSAVTRELKLGFAFAVGVSAQNIYSDLDKSMLAKLSTLEATGIYGAAYHILNVAFAPIQSLMYASFRTFFQQGASGIKGSFDFCKKLLPLSLGYSLIAILGLIVFAPLLPLILGAEYQNSAWALMWLSPTIFFRTMHSFGADTLTGANYQSARSISQVMVAVFNGLLNFWLIPIYGWHGAIWATIASECLLMIFLWSFVFKYSRQSA